MSRRPPAAHARLQLYLAAAAIAAAVALPVVLVSVGGGVSAHEIGQLEQSGYELSVSAAGAHGILDSHALSRQFDGLAHVAAASPVLSAPIDAFVLRNGTPTAILAEGVVPDQFGPTLGPGEDALFPLPLPLGDPTDLVHFANGTYAGRPSYDVLLATPFAAEAGLSVGDRIRLGPNPGGSGAILYNVSGMFGVSVSSLAPTGAFAVLLPLSDLQTMVGVARGGPNGTALLDASDTIQIALTGSLSGDPAAVSAVAQEVQALVPYYGVTTQLQQAQQLESASAILTGFYLALSSVGLVVGLIFLAIVLTRRVESDRRAIGIRRAIGVPARSIGTGIALRALALAAAGATIGVVGGWAIVTSLARYSSGAVQEATSYAVYDPLLLGGIVASVLGLAALVSLVATRAALRLDLSEVLR